MKPRAEGLGSPGPSAYAEAWRLFVHHGLFGVPVSVTYADGKKDILGLVQWRERFYDGSRDAAALEQAWDGHEDAPGLAIFVGERAGFVAIDPDTDDAEDYVRKHGVPRTPSFRSRRGIKRLFRYPTNANLRTGHIADGLELRAEWLLIVPPTEGYAWLPSLALEDVEVAELPDWARLNGHRTKTKIVTAAEIPPGEAHDTITRIVGKLAGKVSSAELLTIASALNTDRLPEDELHAIVESIAAKEEPAERVPTPTGTTLADVHAAFDQGLLLPDKTLVDVAIAAVVANLLEVDPVFLLIVAASSRGKTEVVDSLRAIPETHSLSTLTKATLLSGYHDPRAPTKDHSMLPKLTKAGARVLLMKDFTTVLSQHRDERSAILAQLREVFDGSIVRATGTGQELAWEGHLGFIAGVTPAIDSHTSVIALLGERWTYLRVPDHDRRAAAAVAAAGRGRNDGPRQERRRVVAELVAGLDLSEPPWFREETVERVIALADFATLARTPVQRDGYGNREILMLPEPEAPMRYMHQVLSLGQGLRLLGYDEERVVTLARRLARDAVPPVRVRCLDLLADGSEPSGRQAAEQLGLPTSTVSRALEELAALGLVLREGSGTAENAANRWSIAPGVSVPSAPDVSGGLPRNGHLAGSLSPPSPPQTTNRVQQGRLP